MADLVGAQCGQTNPLMQFVQQMAGSHKGALGAGPTRAGPADASGASVYAAREREMLATQSQGRVPTHAEVLRTMREARGLSASHEPDWSQHFVQGLHSAKDPRLAGGDGAQWAYDMLEMEHRRQEQQRAGAPVAAALSPHGQVHGHSNARPMMLGSPMMNMPFRTAPPPPMHFAPPPSTDTLRQNPTYASMRVENAWQQQQQQQQQQSSDYSDAPLQYTRDDQEDQRTGNSSSAQDATEDPSELARAAAALAKTMQDDPQMRNSQFMSLMNRLGRGEVTFKDNELVSTEGDQWAQEYLKTTTTTEQQRQTPQARPDDAGMEATANAWAGGTTEDRAWLDAFKDSDWAPQGESEGPFDMDGETYATVEDWARSYEESLNTDPAMSAEVQRLEEEYVMAAENEYVGRRDLIGEGERLQREGQLAKAVLSFEAAVRELRETLNETVNSSSAVSGDEDALRKELAHAWLLLGLAQAENEMEAEAIRALKQCITLEHDNLRAYMGLAVSYTNEGRLESACESLLLWLQHNARYSSLTTSLPSPQPPLPHLQQNDSPFLHVAPSHTRVRDLYIEAALMSPDAIDPDVQINLGVLFNLSSEYDKATDCFNAALSVRPDDALVWNKLGATLANNGQSEKAVDAYYTALQLRPGFIRARYNLGISCINLRAYPAAAEHFLHALSLQHQNALPNGQSGIWDTLRLALSLMDRHDLAQLISRHNLDDFRSDFEF